MALSWSLFEGVNKSGLFMSYRLDITNKHGLLGSRVAQQSKVLYLTTNPGSIPGCITTGPDWESYMAVHYWPSVVRVRVGPGEGRHCEQEFVLN